ncbi:MAG: Stp1/IreP family PP2C-type Ser/Thr phosphatase [Ruminococcaceae bacterium]|nr:Stp1/IreP family PP2C-type Ser/Thr phosphatase [Oscillospiraceae bacterium]
MQYWGITDPGCVRSQNQDTFQIKELSPTATLCIVCDGMGGAKSGNVASKLATEVFVEEVCRTYTEEMAQAEIDQMLRAAVKLANFTVYDQGQQFEEFSGMGTTLVAALVKEKELTIVNVGDSRAYAITDNGIQKITADHSLVELMVQRGELTPEEARAYPGKNYITRAIGTEAIVECDLYHLDVEQEHHLLLCSDGLSNMVDEQEILFEVVHGENKEQCCVQLLDIAKKRGAPDNVTCILVRI